MTDAMKEPLTVWVVRNRYGHIRRVICCARDITLLLGETAAEHVAIPREEYDAMRTVTDAQCLEILEALNQHCTNTQPRHYGLPLGDDEQEFSAMYAIIRAALTRKD